MKKLTNTKAIQEKANLIRQEVIKSLVAAGSGHSAGPLGLADIFATLYFNVLDHKPKRPDWDGRDRLCLSCGHVTPVRYAAMALAGYFPKSHLKTLRKLGSPLQGHPSLEHLPSVEHSSGPLGQGTSVSVGMALADKMDKKRRYTYCVVSDGEQQEGQVWEAAMMAGKHKLNNLIWIMDRNNIQIDGFTEDVMPLEPLRQKYEAFGWHVLEIDGHNIQDIMDACNFAKTMYSKPTMIIAHTIPGKGVEFMEGDFRWHGAPPGGLITERTPSKEAQAREALKALRTLQNKITSEHE
jgi:transketolase